MVDNVELGREFRKQYARGLKRLLRQGKLKLGGRVDFLNDSQVRQTWLDDLESTDWNVFIEGPPGGPGARGATPENSQPSHSQPSHSQPSHIVRYLARYLTGGPISDSRILKVDAEDVTFLARPKRNNKAKIRARSRMARPIEHRLTGRVFMQRWCLHILPEGFTKTRWYGGYHGAKRQGYMELCRTLLHISADETDESSEPHEHATPAHQCPHCGGELEVIEAQLRPSWKEVFNERIYAHGTYCPSLHIACSRGPPLRKLPTTPINSS